jgi:hypothetical protein
VKAGDTSPVGAFKTSTIEALHVVIDEKKGSPLSLIEGSYKNEETTG